MRAEEGIFCCKVHLDSNARLPVYFREACGQIQHGNVTTMETATPLSPLVIAVVEDNPADVYCIARVLQAHGLLYSLQVLARLIHKPFLER